MTPFDYVKSIQSEKTDLMTDALAEKEYLPFIINRSLSYQADCIFHANEMNRRPLLDKKLQYHYLLNTIRSRKRPFVKWTKSKVIDDLDIISRVYGFSRLKAAIALPLISQENLELLKEKAHTGGLKKSK